MEMICVAKGYLTANIFEVASRKTAFYSGACGYVHERRRFNVTMYGRKPASSGGSLGFYNFKHIKRNSFTDIICLAEFYQEINIASPKLKKR
jgi:hypothetical protein